MKSVRFFQQSLGNLWIIHLDYSPPSTQTAVKISELENIFELNRDNAGIEQIREDVEAYEDAVRKQAALTEQVRLKEQAAKELDSKAKSIKSKSIGNESKK